MESNNIIVINDENDIPCIPDLIIIDKQPIVEGNKLLEYYNKKWGEFQNKEFNVTELLMEIKNENEINSNDKSIIINHLKLLVKYYKSQNTNIVNCLLLLERFLNKKITSKVMLNLLKNFASCQQTNLQLIKKTTEQSIKEIESQCTTLNKNNKLIIKLYQLLNPKNQLIKDIKLDEHYFDDDNEISKSASNQNNQLSEFESKIQLELELELDSNDIYSGDAGSGGNTIINYEEEFKSILKRLESDDLKFHLSLLNKFIESINKEFEQSSSTTTTTTTTTIQDIKSSIKSYIDTTCAVLMHDCAAVPFELDNNEILESKSTPIVSLSNKPIYQIKKIICEFLEHYILSSKLYNKIFTLNQLIEKDKLLNDQISKYKNITLKNLDINYPNIITNQLVQLVKDKINQMVTEYKSPREKLQIIKQIINIIVKVLSKNQKDDNIIGADLLLPTLIYCFIKSNIKSLNSNLEYISIFRDSSLLENEIEYYLVTMVTAATFIENMTSNSLTKDKSNNKSNKSNK